MSGASLGSSEDAEIKQRNRFGTLSVVLCRSGLRYVKQH